MKDDIKALRKRWSGPCLTATLLPCEGRAHDTGSARVLLVLLNELRSEVPFDDPLDAAARLVQERIRDGIAEAAERKKSPTREPGDRPGPHGPAARRPKCAERVRPAPAPQAMKASFSRVECFTDSLLGARTVPLGALAEATSTNECIVMAACPTELSARDLSAIDSLGRRRLIPVGAFLREQIALARTKSAAGGLLAKLSTSHRWAPRFHMPSTPANHDGMNAVEDALMEDVRSWVGAGAARGWKIAVFGRWPLDV